jgi:hypothetical protein
VSLVETRRVDGKVRQEHIAGLGSIEVPPSVADRITFWQRLHERFAKLSNRVDAATQTKTPSKGSSMLLELKSLDDFDFKEL